MRRAALIIALLPLPAFAQSEDEGRLVGFIEGALSDGAARGVDLQGFRGALSSEASLDLLRVSDADGVWLEIENARLDWNRAAVLRGRIEINALVADRVSVIRLPVSEETGPTAEATPFSLPELPVSINVATAEIGRLELGAPILGEALSARATASLTLADGAGMAGLEVSRLDGPEGEVSLEASYDNTSAVLSLDLAVVEGANGLAVSLLDIAGEPPITLNLTADGPLDGIAAEFALATDGIDRLAGQATSAAQDDGAVVYDLAVEGDLSPILSADAAAFLGDDATIRASALRASTGALTLDPLSIRAAALSVDGSLQLDDAGQPLAFALTGDMGARDGSGRLALPGGDAEIDSAGIDLSYDRAQGDAVAGHVTLSALSFQGFSAPDTRLTLEGEIARDDTGVQITGFAGDVTFLADGLSHDDPAIAGAIGPRAMLSTEVAWQPGAGLALRDLTLGTATAQIAGNLTATPGEERLDIVSDLAVVAGDLSPFGALAGQPVSGAATIETDLRFEALSGAFDTNFTARTDGLALPGLVPDDLLTGRMDLTGSVSRDTGGITIETVELDGRALALALAGRFGSGTADLSFDAALDDLALLELGLAGPAEISGHLDRESAQMPYRLSDLAVATDFAELDGMVTALPGDATFPITADLNAGVDLDGLSGIAGMALAGRVDARIAGSGDLREERASLETTVTTQDIRAGDALPPWLLAGETLLEAALDFADTTLTVETFELDGREITASATGTLGPADSDLTLSARLRDASRLTAALPGAVSVTADVLQQGGGPYGVTANATGPAGLRATVTGDVTPDLTLALDVNGAAPLVLANPFIAPQTITGTANFALGVNGPPAIGSVSGRVRIDGGRLGVPAQNVALNDMNLSADIAGGGADLNLTGGISTGGTLAVSGRVGFADSALPADLNIAIDNGRFVDPELYDATIASLRLSLAGALAASSRLSGQIDLGTVEVRVPESGIGSAGPVPDIRHIGETAEERRTRSFAGLLDRGDTSGGSSRIGLDIGISAPGRIFLRGRGLDAELGGTLRIGGTTANVVPSGRFELIRGRLSILGQRLDLTEGSVSLRGGDPYLSLAAQTQAGDYTVIIGIEGSASAPEVSFRSQPELPEDEVLAQLFFGRSASSLSALQAIQLADAVASFAGGGSSVFVRLREGLGLDNLDVQTDEAGNAVVSAGRYLSDNVYADVSVDGEGTGVSLNIDLTPSITARGGVSSSGESSIGVFFERDY